MIDTSDDFENVGLHLFPLLRCKLVPIKMWHDNTGEHTKKVGLENVGDTGRINGEVCEQTR